MTSVDRSENTILCVVGARPNFMKIAPIIRAFSQAEPPIQFRLVHTGQHYDWSMQRQFFDELDIPEPDYDLGVGSGTHAVQTAEVMLRFEPVMLEVAPRAVLVVGDVNSTLACALVAAKRLVPVFHVESGLRSDDRTMPEEINRILTDQLSDLLFTTEESAAERLAREGISLDKVHFVGNVMIDTLLSRVPQAVPNSETFELLGLERPTGAYAVVTLHRPSNVDAPETLRTLTCAIAALARHARVVFPAHPRTRAKLEEFGLMSELEAAGVGVCGPLGYLQMMGLIIDAALVLTDSGGLQEETSALGIPCLTLRENTERPITVTLGTNRIVGTDSERILYEAMAILRHPARHPARVPGWDGLASTRIADTVNKWLAIGPTDA